MATNKRKDAAALFELIDKSTLKVPKGGSLKIPSWWSSKTNPATTGAGGPSRVGEDVESESGGAPTIERVPAAVPQAKSKPAEAAPARPTEEGVVQRRLFDPPPLEAPEPESSPTIRAPAPVPVAEPVVQPVAAAAEAAVPAEPAAPKPRVVPMASPRRTFAPQTLSQSQVARGNASANLKLNFARAPGWVLITAAAGALLVVVLIVYAIFGGHGRTTPTENTDSSGGAVPLTRTTETPAPGSTGVRQQEPAPNTNNHVPVAPAPQPLPQKGTVYEAGKVQRSPELYYVWIASTPEEKIARRNAEFLAMHGVDVSIEVRTDKKVLYQIISVAGFKSAEEAEPFRRKIVEIGHQTDVWKKTRQAWDDAWTGKVVMKKAAKK